MNNQHASPGSWWVRFLDALLDRPRSYGFTLEGAIAPPIEDNSWLNQDRFAEFRAGYDYAAGCKNAIPGLSRVTPEDAYYIWSLIQRGVERHRVAEQLAVEAEDAEARADAEERGEVAPMPAFRPRRPRSANDT